MLVFLDTETYSETPIKNGTFRYAEDAEIMIGAYAFDDGEVKIWDATKDKQMPAELHSALRDPKNTVVMHNAMFDRTVMRYALGLDLAISRVHDTMVMALAHSLPGGLGPLCEILGVDADKSKDKIGKQLINFFCKPRPADSKVRRYTRTTHPVEWQQFCDYAALDIISMREVYKKLPKWNHTEAEKNLWAIDQRINQRGFLVDIDLAESAIKAVEIEQKRLGKRTNEITDGDVPSTTQRDLLLAYILKEHGVELPDMRKSTLERRVQDPELPAIVRELLVLRLQASATSTSKYAALIKSVNKDNRLRGTLQFCGAARTGRDAGRTFQPQNLPQPKYKHDEIEVGIRALKAGCADLLFENVMKIAGSCIRGSIIAPPGKKLVISDLANIEGRLAAWLSKEQWKLDAFYEYDAKTGPDLYNLAYAKAFDMSVGDVSKDQRQIGKVLELSCFGPKTKVLTDKGIVNILDVTTEHRLWDGIEWVKHEGLVAKGVRKTVNVAGIKVTPEHLMLTGQTWKAAEQLATNENFLYQALVTGSANLPYKVSNMEARGVCNIFLSNAIAALPHIKYSTTTFVKEKVLGAMFALKNNPLIGKRIIPLTRIFYPTYTTVAAFLTESPRVLLGVITKMTGATTTTVGGVSGFLNLGVKTEQPFYNTSYHWMTGINRCLNWIELTSIKGTNRGIYDLYLIKTIKGIVGKYLSCKQESKNWSSVYDIMNSGSRNRFTVISDAGPLIAHNCGYGGGVGAFVTFAAGYGVNLEALADKAWDNIPADVKMSAKSFYTKQKEQDRHLGLSERVFITCDSLKRMWRAAHPNLSQYWYELENTAKMALSQPGVSFESNYVKMVKTKAWLRIILPSGRNLCYPGARLDKDGITYMGMNQYTRKWARLSTFGGKLLENICQAVARDILMHGMVLSEEKGYATLLRIHDELVTEVPDTDKYSSGDLSELMSTNPGWAMGLPLAAAGFETTRYRKD